jgi:hypothetical protein
MILSSGQPYMQNGLPSWPTPIRSIAVGAIMDLATAMQFPNRKLVQVSRV